MCGMVLPWDGAIVATMWKSVREVIFMFKFLSLLSTEFMQEGF